MPHNLGSLILDEMIWPITKIYLEAGQIYIEATNRGPLDLRGLKMVRLHSPDGQLVARNNGIDLNITVPDKEEVVFTWQLNVDSKLTHDSRVTIIEKWA